MSSKKKKAVLLDHGFHRKTRSSEFFAALLQTRYDVSVLWDESWQGGDPVGASQINALDPDVAVFWQSIPSIEELRKVRASMVFVPMYDAMRHTPDYFWMQLVELDLRVVSFCRRLAEQVRRNRVPVRYAQYYPEQINRDVPPKDRYSVFLWQRRSTSLDDVASLLPSRECSRVVLKIDPDPGHPPRPPSQKIMDTYPVEIVEGFLPLEQYRAILDQVDLFIAPRRYEGIGLGFLEALARGQAVLGYDYPTLNEYVADGKNGFLLPCRREPIQPAHVHQASGECVRRFAQGRTEWCESIAPLLEWIETPLPSSSRPSQMRLFYAFGKRFFKKMERESKSFLLGPEPS